MSNFTHIAHDDHDLTTEHVALLQTDPDIAKLDDGVFVLTTIVLPSDVESLPCGLYGPEAGDAPVTDAEASLEVRGNRQGPSRLIDKPHRNARNMVVIGIKGGVCFTAYGSRAKSPSPMEPWDAERKQLEGKASAEDVARSQEFWSVHALAARGENPNE